MEKMKKIKKKPIIVIVVIAALLIGGGTFVKVKLSQKVSEMATEDMGIQAQPLEKHDLSAAINATGTVESQNVVVVTTDITSKVKTLNVGLGDYVEKGQVLCTFDDTEIKEQIADLESQASAAQKSAAKQQQIAQRNLDQAKSYQAADVAAAQAKVNDAQSAVNAAQAAYDAEPNKEIDNDGTTTLDALNSAKAALDSAKADLTQTQRTSAESVQQAQDAMDTDTTTTDSKETSKELAKLYRQLDNVTVKAEQSGIITSLNVSQGSIPNGTLMQIEDNENLKVKVSIKEKDITKIQEGMKATITSDALPDEEVTGNITKVINFATSSVDTGDGTSAQGGSNSGSSYSAEISLEPGSKLLLGMTAKVEIKLNDAGEVISVPYDSIAVDDDGKNYVYQATATKEDGMYKISRVDVEVGDAGDYYTAITSDKLKEGDLIVNYPDMVSDGDEIELSISDGSEMENLATEDVAE